MKNKLKPCPFCGSDEIQFRIHGYFRPSEGEGMHLWYHCECSQCGASADGGCGEILEQEV